MKVLITTNSKRNWVTDTEENSGDAAREVWRLISVGEPVEASVQTPGEQPSELRWVVFSPANVVSVHQVPDDEVEAGHGSASW